LAGTDYVHFAKTNQKEGELAMEVMHGMGMVQVLRNRLSIHDGEKEIGRATVYFLTNDKHTGQTFALLEDVWVDEDYRGQGLAKKIVLEAIASAQANSAYKMIATTRYEPGHYVYDLYLKLGFEDHGTEFRMDFDE